MTEDKLTAFEPNCEKILDETLEAPNDDEAKKKGEALIEEKGIGEKSYRCTSSNGKLILFQS